MHTRRVDLHTDRNRLTGREPEAVDWSVLDELKALQRPGKPDVREKLITTYISKMPALMENIRKAVMASDGVALTEAAHSLKSSSLSLGAIPFGTTCGELEQLGRSGSLESALILLSRAEREFSATCREFRAALEQIE